MRACENVCKDLDDKSFAKLQRTGGVYDYLLNGDHLRGGFFRDRGRPSINGKGQAIPPGLCEPKPGR